MVEGPGEESGEPGTESGDRKVTKDKDDSDSWARPAHYTNSEVTHSVVFAG